jgi:hypothetical protein
VVEPGELRGQPAGPARRRRLGWRTLVATMEPLIHDPAIQNALTDKITAEITTRLNVTSRADQAAAELSSRGLPRLSTLLKSEAPAIASGVAGFVHSEVHKIVTGRGSPRPGSGPTPSSTSSW